MKVLIIGKHGQLAWELQRTAPKEVEVVALASCDLNIADAVAVNSAIEFHQPHAIINCAAYTAVDKAESDSDAAYAVNHLGVKHLALACHTNKTRLLHVSTDFVFDGKQSFPYTPAAKTNPIGVYGASKLAGEQAVLEVLDNAIIVRTAWVYSTHGNNFVKTMLRLMSERPQLGVVYEQVGTPTWAKGLAQWLWAVAAKNEITGTYHWTDNGVASWYDFAVAIQELAVAKGLLKASIPIRPIAASAYPTPAQRPFYSVLDKTSAEAVTGMQTVYWRTALNNMLDELKNAS